MKTRHLFGNAWAPEDRPEGPLSGLRVCYLNAKPLTLDTNGYRKSFSLYNAGAEIIQVSGAAKLNAEWAETPFEFFLTGETEEPEYIKWNPSTNKIWLLRVVHNLCVESFVRIISRHKQRSKRLVTRWVDGKWPAMQRALIKAKPDVIHVTNLYSIYPALRAADVLGCRLVYDSQEYWRSVIKDPVSAELFPAVRHEEWLKLEKEMVKKATTILVVANSPYDPEVYDLSKIVVIYNGPLSRADSVSPVHSPIKILFQGHYSGATTNLPVLLEAARLLNPDFDMYFQGRGFDESGVLAERIRQNPISNVHLLGSVPYAQVIDAASAFDVGIYPANKYDNGFYNQNIEYTLPNKLFSYMAAGLVCAFPDLYSCKKIIESKQAGGVISVDDPARMAADIRKLCSDTAAVRAMKQNAWEAACEFLWERQEEKLIAAYSKLKDAMKQDCS
jgi:glycosyltransferase involved in cell wall biosynthesis